MAKVLVVDDDPDFCEITRIVLEGAGHEVSLAANGDQAFERMCLEPPDLVILDVMMSSVLDGLHLTDRMRAEPRLSGIPIVMVSAIASSHYASLFPTDIYLGLDTWLSKPVAPQALLDTVERMLGQ